MKIYLFLLLILFPVFSSAWSCYTFNYNFGYKSTDSTTGGEVSRLQSFLGLRQTGGFGLVTAYSLWNFQVENKIIPASSNYSPTRVFFGPITRAKISQICEQGQTTQNSLAQIKHFTPKELPTLPSFGSTYQSHIQSVVSIPMGYFVSYMFRSDDSQNSEFRILRSIDGGDTFTNIIAGTSQRAPAIDIDKQNDLYISYSDPLTNKLYTQFINWNNKYQTGQNTNIAGSDFTTYAKYTNLFDDSASELLVAPIQGEIDFARLVLGTASFYDKGKKLFSGGPVAYAHYPYLSKDESTGRIYYGWTTTPNKDQSKYRSNHFIYSDDRGETWFGKSGKLTLPIVEDETGPSFMVTDTTDLDKSPWMDNILSENGMLHLIYNNGIDWKLKYARYNSSSNSFDVLPTSLVGSQIYLSGNGAFLTYDKQTKVIYAVGSTGDKIGILKSSDQGKSWEDFALSSSVGVPYAISGARFVSADGNILGVFTENNSKKVYFIKIPVW